MLAVFLPQLHLLPHARLQNLQSDRGAVQAGLPWFVPLRVSPGSRVGAGVSAGQVYPGLGVPQIGLLLRLTMRFLWPTIFTIIALCLVQLRVNSCKLFYDDTQSLGCSPLQLLPCLTKFLCAAFVILFID